MDPVTLSNLCHVSCLMYADDVVIISKSPSGLQKCLDASHDYCQEWKLNVNLKKTQAMVFSNKLRKNNKLSFTFNNKELKTVSQITYLGVTIKSTGSFLPNHSSLSIKAERAIFALDNRGKLKQLPIDIAHKLFDSCINPIRTYGSEVWLPYNNESYRNWNSTEIETTQLYFLKHILGLNRSSTNILVRGELEKFPLKCATDIRAVQFYKHASIEI